MSLPYFHTRRTEGSGWRWPERTPPPRSCLQQARQPDRATPALLPQDGQEQGLFLPPTASPHPRSPAPGLGHVTDETMGEPQAPCGDFRESSSPPVRSLLLSTAQAAAWHPPPPSVNPTFLSRCHPVSRHLTCTAAAQLQVCSCSCSAAGTLLSWDTRRLSPVGRWLEPPHAQAVVCLSARSTWVASCLSSGLEARAL